MSFPENKRQLFFSSLPSISRVWQEQEQEQDFNERFHNNKSTFNFYQLACAFFSPEFSIFSFIKRSDTMHASPHKKLEKQVETPRHFHLVHLMRK